MTPRIQKAIDIFLDALNEGTLKKGSCAYCAVGNLIREGASRVIDLKALKPDDVKEIASSWGDLFFTNSLGIQCIQPNQPTDTQISKARKIISYTDFTEEELMKIEYAFEKNAKIHNVNYFHYSKEEIKQDQINGLKAVVQVMLDFEEQVDDVNEVFTEKAVLCN